MPLQAEIQKRQQAVSDLKRQVEQITALAGDDKKAGIRVADALRKRKLRASLKDVKIRDPADVQRRVATSSNSSSSSGNTLSQENTLGDSGRGPVPHIAGSRVRATWGQNGRTPLVTRRREILRNLPSRTVRWPPEPSIMTQGSCGSGQKMEVLGMVKEARSPNDAELGPCGMETEGPMQETDPWHLAINARLAEIVAAAGTQPAWYEAWSRLGPESTEDERLAVYQAIRNAGCLPADAGFYLVSWQIDAMTSMVTEVGLRDIQARLIDYELEHGDEEMFQPHRKPPKEIVEARRQYQDAWDAIFVRKLDSSGEHEMAELFRSNPEEFERRSEAGRQYFHDADDPEAWLDELAEAVADNMEAQDMPGQLGMRYQEEDGLWYARIYPKPVELVGGAEDGEMLAPGFLLDLDGLQTLFDTVHAVRWYSLGFPGDEGPRVVIEGIYQGHELCLQVLAYAPEDEEPGMKVPSTERRAF